MHRSPFIGPKTARLSALTALAIVASTALAGCSLLGGDSEPESARALKVAYMGIMGSTALPPVEASSDVSVHIMSCGQLSTGCAGPAAALDEAATAIGWNATVTDGQLNPAGFAAAIREAIAAEADVLIPVGIDCTSAEEAFVEAKQAGIVIVGGGGMNDCAPLDGEPVWATERLWIDGRSPEDVWRLQGALQANYLIGTTDAAAKVLLLNFADQVWGPWITEGFTKQLATCANCEIVSTLDIMNADWIDGTAPTKFADALASVPDANAVAVPIDDWLASGIAEAVVDSGRGDELWVVGRGGDPDNFDLILAGKGQDATVAYAAEWGAWGSIDTAARVLAGAKPLYVGEAIQVVDAKHNLPEAGMAYQGSEFRDAYLTAWGLAPAK